MSRDTQLSVLDSMSDMAMGLKRIVKEIRAGSAIWSRSASSGLRRYEVDYDLWHVAEDARVLELAADHLVGCIDIVTMAADRCVAACDLLCHSVSVEANRRNCI